MKKALIIVDPQNDFCDFFQGAPLGVKDSEHIFPIINQLKKMDKFSNVFITLDWHPSNHSSFAKNHGKEPFSQIIHQNKKQMLWPEHCVQGTQGAKPSKLLKIQKNDMFIKKGVIHSQQQYSGFGTKENPTSLQKKLKKLGIQSVVIVGLAFDYCVGSTALDAKEAGFETVIIRQGTKAVSQQTAEIMAEKLREKQIQIISFRSFE